MESGNLGTMMKNAQAAGLRWLAGLLTVIVYLGGIVFAEVHNWTLLAKTMDSNLIVLAGVGVVAMGLMAIALPLLIHYNTEPGPHRLTALGLYGLDLAIMAINTVIDANMHTGAPLTDALKAWMYWVVPVVPLIMVFGVGVLWLLSPDQRERDTWASIQAATARTLQQKVMAKASGEEVDERIDAAADVLLHRVLGEALDDAVPQPKKKAEQHTHANYQQLPTPRAEAREPTEAEAKPEPASAFTEPPPIRISANGHKKPVGIEADPK